MIFMSPSMNTNDRFYFKKIKSNLAVLALVDVFKRCSLLGTSKNDIADVPRLSNIASAMHYHFKISRAQWLGRALDWELKGC